MWRAAYVMQYAPFGVKIWWILKISVFGGSSGVSMGRINRNFPFGSFEILVLTPLYLGFLLSSPLNQANQL